jgi:lactoylglutathione lyase
MRLRLELFVIDVARSRTFYHEVLGFAASDENSDAYVQMTLGDTVISLNRYHGLPPEHPIRGRAGEPLGLGVEIVLEVPDLRERHERLKAQGIALLSDLERRPWGLEDFRLADPDGYYLRLTEHRTADGMSAP